MTKKVYFEPAGRIHTWDKELILYPPEGYEFLIGQTNLDKTTRKLLNSDFLFFGLRVALDKLLPIPLVKARLESSLKSIPEEADLIFSRNHLIFRKKPWIVHLERATSLTGLNPRHLQRHKGTVEKVLGSDYCKKILTWSEVARKSIVLDLNCTKFEYKIEILPLAVHRKSFNKNYKDTKIKLLFVGTANRRGDFELKGGKEVLEAFSHLVKRFGNLELTIRSDIPKAIKTQYEALPNIKWIESIIPQEQLEQEFRTTDIFVLPSHHTPWVLILDAMSYELPVVTTDVYANPELVDNGVTGFLIKKSGKVPYPYQSSVPPDDLSRHRFKEAIRTVDLRVVQDLVQKISILIENPELRRRMGRAARWEVEEGKHSIKKRNKKLKSIFDEAIG